MKLKKRGQTPFLKRGLSPFFAAALAAFLFASGPAWAQAPYPNRPITLIVPWPAGGSTDTHLRKLAELASKHLGQPIIVENRPGAGGMLGPAGMASAARPDGYTLSQLTVAAFRQPHMQKVEWDPLKDFTYIIGVSGYTFGVVVTSDSPFKNFNELIAHAKANPGKLSYGSTGTGTSPHLLMEEVAGKTGVAFLHVPYKGNADSTQALMGGHVMAQSDATGWGKFVDAGSFRLLVTFGDQRTRWGAPTAKELGIDVVSYSPYGIVGPKGMDPKVVKTLHDAFKKAIDDPENQKVLASLDQVYWYKSSEDYAKWAADTLKAERATIERVGLLLKN
jgi:tripartite-type tricarboxylate transporter receptor subunit TctC